MFQNPMISPDCLSINYADSLIQQTELITQLLGANMPLPEDLNGDYHQFNAIREQFNMLLSTRPYGGWGLYYWFQNCTPLLFQLLRCMKHYLYHLTTQRS